MRRYELMMVLRADLPEDRLQSTLERIIRAVAGSGGQIVKVSPWGRRRLAYEIDHQREGSYHIVVFEAEPSFVQELERSLLISEEVLRHLVTRIERPARARRVAAETAEEEAEIAPPSEEPEEDEGELIDESESEAAPAAIERD